MPQTDLKNLYYPTKVNKAGVLVVAQTQGRLDAGDGTTKPDTTVFWPADPTVVTTPIPLGVRRTSIKDALLAAQKMARKELSTIEKNLAKTKKFLDAVDEGLAHPEKVKIVKHAV